MTDGVLGKCKDCARHDARRHRGQNIDRIRDYDRLRSKLPHRIASSVKVTRNWRQANPVGQRAHNASARAGLVAPALCEGCNQEKKLEKHHPDYSQPLLVMWLCKPCHALADKVRRKTEEGVA